MIIGQIIPQAVNTAVKNISDFLLPYAVAASAVGALSMALIQTIKDIFPLRGWYQRYKLKVWFKSKKREISNLLSKLDHDKFFRWLHSKKCFR